MIDSLIYLIKVLHIVLSEKILQSDGMHLAGGHHAVTLLRHDDLEPNVVVWILVRVLHLLLKKLLNLLNFRGIFVSMFTYRKHS